MATPVSMDRMTITSPQILLTFDPNRTYLLLAVNHFHTSLASFFKNENLAGTFIF
jgi:hypothetical protein